MSSSLESSSRWFKARILLTEFRDELWHPDHTRALLDWLMNDQASIMYFWIEDSTLKSICLGYDKLQKLYESGHVSQAIQFCKRRSVAIESYADLSSIVYSSLIRSAAGLDDTLTLLSSVFVPYSASSGNVSQSWPENTRREFLNQTRKFMACAVEISNQARGSTVLYVPPISIAGSKADKDTVQRLEASLIQWTRQIKDAIANATSSIGSSGGPLGELAFWQIRCTDFSSMHSQLQSPQLQTILGILGEAKSSYLPQFSALEKDIEKGAAEAEDNLKFLSVLKIPCDKLQAAATPEAMMLIFPTLLSAVRFIWSDSRYYNTSEKITGLLKRISLDIIKYSSQAVPVEKLFEAGNVKVHAIKASLEDCVACCKQWQSLYHKTVALVASKHAPLSWDFLEGAIFAQVDAFTQRCVDLLEICDWQLQFIPRLLNKTLPQFGGSRGDELLSSLADLESSLVVHLSTFSKVDYNILDAKSLKWRDDFIGLKAHVKEIEVAYLNIISTGFESVSTVEGAVQVLDNFSRLAYRESVWNFVRKKARDACNLFMQEAAAVAREFEAMRSSPRLPVGAAPLSGACVWARGLRLRVERKFKALEDLSHIVPAGSKDLVSASEAFSNLHASLEGFINLKFKEWVLEIQVIEQASSFTQRLEIPLLIKVAAGESVKVEGLLESGFDKALIRLMEEAYGFEKIAGSSVHLPSTVREICESRVEMKTAQNLVLCIVREYNSILLSLAPEERRLLAQHLRELDSVIQPGLTSLTWTSQVKSFVEVCLDKAAKVQTSVALFKSNHQTILGLCKNLGDSMMVKIERKVLYLVDEFRQLQSDHRAKTESNFKRLHEDICYYLKNTHSSLLFGQPAEIQREFRSYVAKMDRRIEEALKKAIKTSLQAISKALKAAGAKLDDDSPVDAHKGEGVGESQPLLKIHATLQGSVMDLKPTLTVLKEVIQSICREMTLLLNVLPRLEADRLVPNGPTGGVAGVSLGVADEQAMSYFQVISKDEDSVIKYIKDVLKIFNSCSNRLADKLKWWVTSYQPVVSLEKDAFIKRYARLDRPSAVIGRDIVRYKQVQSEIQQEEFKAIIGFVELDFTGLKADLIAHCAEWQDKFVTLLRTRAIADLDSILDFFESNTRALQTPPVRYEELRDLFDRLQTCHVEIGTVDFRIQHIQERFSKLQEFEEVDDKWIESQESIPFKLSEFKDSLRKAEVSLNKAKKLMRVKFDGELVKLSQSMKELNIEFVSVAPFSDLLQVAEAQEIIEKYTASEGNARDSIADLAFRLKLFEMDEPTFIDLETMSKEMKMLRSVWLIRSEWDAAWLKLSTLPFIDCLADQVSLVITTFAKRLADVSNESTKSWTVLQSIDTKMTLCVESLGLLSIMRDERVIRPRHWEQLKVLLKQSSFDPYSPLFSVADFITLDLRPIASAVIALGNQATSEERIESKLGQVEKQWSCDIKLVITERKPLLTSLARDGPPAGLYELQQNPALTAVIEEHSTTLASLKQNMHSKPFASEIIRWLLIVGYVEDVVTSCLHWQKLAQNLESLFASHGDSLRTSMLSESDAFDDANYELTMIYTFMVTRPLAIDACADSVALLGKLDAIGAKLEIAAKALAIFVDKTRRVFPRFFFLSDPEILKIQGSAKEPTSLAPMLPKIFPGLASIEVVTAAPEPNAVRPPGGVIKLNQEVIAFRGGDGERLKLVKSVSVETIPESWLADLEKRIIKTVFKVIHLCHSSHIQPKGIKKDRWVVEFPGQALIVSNQILWNINVATALLQLERGSKSALKSLRKAFAKNQAKVIEVLIHTVDISQMDRLKLGALILQEVHGRDAVDHLLVNKCESTNSFWWQSQMRFTSTDDAIMIEQLQFKTQYGLEYLGNCFSRLVITPMTHRVFLSMTSAMAFGMSAVIRGLTECGKTETIVELSRQLGRSCVVANCSPALDYSSMSKMLSGAALCGIWLCLDEMHQLHFPILAVTINQLTLLQQAALSGKETCVIDGSTLNIGGTAPRIFGTLGPFNVLDATVNAVFRPIGVSQPNMAVVAEGLLTAWGVEDGRVLSKKIIALLASLTDRLGPNDSHYSFGLRSLRSIIKHLEPLHASRELSEHERSSLQQSLIVKAIIQTLEPRLSEEDRLMLRQSLERDIFPSITSHTKSTLVDDVKQLIKCRRGAVALVGPSFSGKTYTLRQAAVEYGNVQINTVYPSLLTADEFIGQAGVDGVWRVGVLGTMIKDCIESGITEQSQWIVLDGPVESRWTDRISTLMDDSSVLVCPDGQRLIMPSHCSLVFETSTLADISPSILSRLSIVYFEKQVGARAIWSNWLTNKLSGTRRSSMELVAKKWLGPLLKPLPQAIHVSDTSLMHSFVDLLDHLLIPLIEYLAAPTGPNQFPVIQVERIFVFCGVWSFGRTCKDKLVFDALIRTTDNLIFPPNHSVFDWLATTEPNPSAPFIQWDDIATKSPVLPGCDIVPTGQIVRDAYILDNCSFPILVGPAGSCRSTALAQLMAVKQADASNWASTLKLAFSAHSKAHSVQKAIESRLERRVRDLYGPTNERKLLCVVDDINLPLSGAPQETLRQLSECGFWYKRNSGTVRIAVEDVKLIGRMHVMALGDSRNDRVFGHANIFYSPATEDASLKKIFGIVASRFLKPSLRLLSDPIVYASIGLLNGLSSKLHLSPDRPHYSFGTQTLSKIFKGMAIAAPDAVPDRMSLVKLWRHEAHREVRDFLATEADQAIFDSCLDAQLEPNFQMKPKELGQATTFGSLKISQGAYNAIDITDAMAVCKQALCDLNSQLVAQGIPAVSILIFSAAVEGLLKILRVMQSSSKHALLVGGLGTGRSPLVQLASFMVGSKYFRALGANGFDATLKLAVRTATREPVTFVFTATEGSEDALNELATFAVTGSVRADLFTLEEWTQLRSEVKLPAVQISQNMTTFICLSPGSQLRSVCRELPGLSSAAKIIWFHDWSRTALEEMARVLVPSADASLLASLHYIASPRVPTGLGGALYSEALRGVSHSHKVKDDALTSRLIMLRKARETLLSAKLEFDKILVEVDTSKEALIVLRKASNSQLQIVTEKRVAFDGQSKSVEMETAKLMKEEHEIKLITDDANKDLQRAMPAFNGAVEALEKLDKQAIAEVKAYAKPPELVMKTLFAVMTVLDKPSTWAQAKAELGEVNFLQKLQNFDKDHISGGTLKRIEKFTKDSTFQYPLVSKVSVAAGALCQWVHAIKNYAEIYHEIEPKRLRVRLGQEAFARKQSQMDEMKANLDVSREALNAAMNESDLARSALELATVKSDALGDKLEMAEKFLSALSREIPKIEKEALAVEAQKSRLLDECVLSSFFGVYCGSFDLVARANTLTEWKGLVSPDSSFDYLSFETSDNDRREWRRFGLPEDKQTEESISMLLNRAAPFDRLEFGVVDPWALFPTWLKKMTLGEAVIVTEKTVVSEIQYTGWLIFDNLSDAALSQVMTTCYMQRLNATKSGDFRPFFCSRTGFNVEWIAPVNLTPTEDGLKRRLVNFLASREDNRIQELLVSTSRSTSDFFRLHKNLENDLLSTLANYKGAILNDEQVTLSLQSTKAEIESSFEKYDTAKQELSRLDNACALYAPLALRAAQIFTTAQSMNKVDPWYQISFENYSETLEIAMQRSAEKHSALTSTAQERLGLLTSTFSLAVIRSILRGYLSHDRIAFLVLYGIKLLPDCAELKILGKPLDLTIIDSLPGCKGVAQSMDSLSTQWTNWKVSAEPERSAYPGEWDVKLTTAQKLLVVALYRPDRLGSALSLFLAQKLGEPKLAEPINPDIELVVDEASPSFPVVLILTSGQVDPVPLINAVALSNRKLGAVPVVHASIPSLRVDEVNEKIKESAVQGSWLCLTQADYYPQVWKGLRTVIPDSRHTNFRLFLICDASRDCSKLSPFVLYRSVKLMMEGPTTVKASTAQWLQPGGLAERLLPDNYRIRRVSLGLAWMQSQLSQRKKLCETSLDVYGFNDVDVSLGIFIVQWFCQPENLINDQIQWDGLRYVLGRVVYGGKAWLRSDFRLIKAFVTEAFSPTLMTSRWLMTRLESHMIPDEMTFTAMRFAVKEFSALETPETLGLHQASQLSSYEVSGKLAIDAISTVCGKVSAVDPTPAAIDTCRWLLDTMPREIEILANEPTPVEDPVRGCIAVEAAALNDFVKYLTCEATSLLDVLESGTGSVITEKQESAVLALAAKRLPSHWRIPYLTTKPLASFRNDLEARLGHLKTVLGFIEQPKVVWMGALSNPHALLAAFLVQASRDKNTSLDQVTFEVIVHKVTDEAKVIASQESNGSLLIPKLILQGAKWTPEGLVDEEPSGHFMVLPLVELKPVVSKKKDQVGDVYSTPLYVCPEKFGNAARKSYITSIDLKVKSNQPESFWIKRGTCLFLSNSN